jgi:hypothetical protein
MVLADSWRRSAQWRRLVDITGATGSGYMPDVYVTESKGHTAVARIVRADVQRGVGVQVNERGMLVAPINLRRSAAFRRAEFARGVTLP